MAFAASASASVAASIAATPSRSSMRTTMMLLNCKSSFTTTRFVPSIRPLSSVPSLSVSESLIRTIRYRRGPICSSVTTAAQSAVCVSVGDKLPDATLSYFDSEGELQTTTVSDITKGKKAIFFAVPGAFTPTCSQKHLPGFIEKADELKAKGVDTIACVSVNDAFVMKAWKKDLNISDDKVLMLSDGNLEFTKALGVELDLSDKPVGLGVRSRRYALLADDGVVKVLNLEEGGAFTVSSAEDMLKAL